MIQPPAMLSNVSEYTNPTSPFHPFVLSHRSAPFTSSGFFFTGAMNRSGSFFRFLTKGPICGLALRLMPPEAGPGRGGPLPSSFRPLGEQGSSSKEAEKVPGADLGVDGRSADWSGGCFWNGGSFGGTKGFLLSVRGFPDVRARRRASLSWTC